MKSLRLIRHFILKSGKRPIKIPLDKPLINEISQIESYVLKTLINVVHFYNNMHLVKEEKEKYSLSLQIIRPEGAYTFNIKENTKTIMYVCFNKDTNEEILLEWELKRTNNY